MLPEPDSKNQSWYCWVWSAGFEVLQWKNQLQNCSCWLIFSCPKSEPWLSKLEGPSFARCSLKLFAGFLFIAGCSTICWFCSWGHSLSCRTWRESPNHRMAGVGRDLCSNWSNHPARAGSPRAGCTGPSPGGFWRSPEKENPQPLWAACSSAPSPSEGRSSSSCSDGTSCASVCARCPLSCHWAPLERVWPRPPDTHTWDFCKHTLGPLSAFSSPGWTSPAPSASPHRTDAPVLSPSS